MMWTTLITAVSIVSILFVLGFIVKCLTEKEQYTLLLILAFVLLTAWVYIDIVRTGA